jgi:hypothetical protein
MRNSKPNFALLPRRRTWALGPLAVVFESVLLPYAWQWRDRQVTDTAVARLGWRLKRELRNANGYPMDSALVCWGLKLCCHYHIQAAKSRNTTDQNTHRDLVDAAYRIITKLEECYGTYELRFLLA